MSYRPKSAGHTAKEAPRGVEQENIGELVERARAFLNKRGVGYEDAYREVAGLETTANVASALAIHPQLRKHESYCELGLFISALWNECCPEHIIVYPHDTREVDQLGQRLPTHKTLIIDGSTGINTGEEAEGTLIVIGKTAWNAGKNSNGPFIIAGSVGDCAGWCSQGPIVLCGAAGDDLAPDATGVLITTRKTEISRAFGGRYISPDEYRLNASLKTYVNRLLALAKDNSLAIEQEFGNSHAIMKRINEIISTPFGIEVKFGDGVKITEEIKLLTGGGR